MHRGALVSFRSGYRSIAFTTFRWWSGYHDLAQHLNLFGKHEQNDTPEIGSSGCQCDAQCHDRRHSDRHNIADTVEFYPKPHSPL